jgi:hypothetical protein
MTDSEPSRNHSIQLSLFRAISARCDEFEADWEHGRPRPLEEYLQPVPLADRPAYFRELLLSLLALDRPADPAAVQHDLLRRFPDCEAIILSVFEESIRASAQESAQQDRKRLTSDAQEALRASLSSPATNPNGSWASEVREQTAESQALWDMIIALASRQANDANPLGQMQALVSELVEMLPQRRRPLLQAALLSVPVAEIAPQFGVTERTVGRTIDAALAVLESQ